MTSSEARRSTMISSLASGRSSLKSQAVGSSWPTSRLSVTVIRYPPQYTREPQGTFTESGRSLWPCSQSCFDTSLLGRGAVAVILDGSLQGMPGQGGTFDPDRKLSDTGKNGQLAELGSDLGHHTWIARQQLME